MNTLHCLSVLFIVGFAYCQISNDLDTEDIEKRIKDNFDLENFNTSRLPTEEDVERLLREKCEKNGGGEEAFEALKNQQNEVRICLEAHLNATEIQAEIEESKKTGSMDEVFGKYCKKYPEIFKCVELVTDKVKPCLDVQEQDTLNKTLKIVAELKEFICFKDGDRIAMFIAEGGVECLNNRKEGLQNCVNATVGSRIPTDFSVSSLPMFLFTDRECNDFDQIRTCFNEELEKCKDSTPANIVDAFFRFLKKHMPCDNIVRQAFSKEGVDRNSGIMTTVSITLITFLVLFSKLL